MRKFSVAGIVGALGVVLFSELSTVARAELAMRSANPKDSLDAVERSLGESIPFNLNLLDQRAPKSQMNSRPWAGPAWSMSSGLIAARYLDSSFREQRNFKSRFDYVRSNSFADIARGTFWFKRRNLDRLSPAEKYDLLVGDMNASLSNALWAEAARTDQGGGIENWMGICDGTAAASVLAAEPVKDLVFRDPIFGNEFTMFASDIKALAALHFSEYVVNAPVVGGRCERDNIDNLQPGESPECEGVSPATWHRSVLFMNGMRGMNAFVDVTPTREVWNTPVISYSYEYFNLKTGSRSSSLDQSIVSLRDLPGDRFASMRSAAAHSVVGVVMTLTTSSGATTATSGSHSVKPVKHVYVYDLELDAYRNLLGGEWHQNRDRPDFVWFLPRGTMPTVRADRELGYPSWDGVSVPASWHEPIVKSSTRVRTMGAIVQKLISMSAN